MLVEVRVKTGCSETTFGKIAEPNIYSAKVKEGAVDGEANHALVELIARSFGVSKSTVTLKRGSRSKIKLFEIV